MDKPNNIGNHLGFPGNIKSRISNVKEKIKNKDNINFKNIHIRIALAIIMIVTIVALVTVAYRSYLIKTAAVDIYIGQDKIGTVRDREDALMVVEDIKAELAETYDMDISFTHDIGFEETHVRDNLLTPIVSFKKTAKAKMGFMVYGYVLSVNGQESGALKTKEDMETVVEMIKAPYLESLNEAEVLKDIRIVEDISIERVEVPFNKVKDIDSIHNYLLTNSEEIKMHKIESGESFWSVAHTYNIPIEDLIAANPDKNPELVQIGDEIKLVLPKPVLTVETTSEVEYEKRIDYETEIQFDDSMYKINQNKKVAGENGLSKILESNVRTNGIIAKKEILREDIIKSPVTEVIVKGTKEPPKTMATGLFQRPTRGRVSSPYGMRNGRMHKGLDIASGSGTSIKAADGGKVVYCGYRGAYGKLVEIDHENGYKTRYAHNSKILVEVGDRVYKGQEISKMGSTGRSTGSHLHFEVIKSGSNQNPSEYVN